MKKLRTTSRRSSPGVCCLVLLGAASAFAQNPTADPVNDAALARLSNADMNVRVEALRELQTTLDPRLPEALLPLLADVGDSIRRLAARGVGSRWHQIPEERAAAYLAALRPLANARDAHPDAANMADRAIGLLSRRYDGPMFAASPDGKWVVYERYGLPCLLDRGRNNEELIGWEGGERLGWFGPAWNNGEVAPAAIWDPRSRAVALEAILSRRVASLWFWIAEGSREVRLDPEDLGSRFLPRGSEIHFAGGFWAEPRRWFGDEFQFVLTFVSVRSGSDDFVDHEVFAGWNLTTGAVREVPPPERPASLP